MGRHRQVKSEKSFHNSMDAECKQLYVMNEPIQASLDCIKGRFIGKLLSGKFTGPKVPSQGSHHGERKRVCAEREKEKERPKCLDYVGKILWGERTGKLKVGD